MPCSGPFLDGENVLPCGSCEHCQKQAQFRLTGRLVAEAFRSRHVLFITPTYSDEYLADNLASVSSDLDSLFQVMRRDMKMTFRHFSVAEEGGKFGRPHAHCLIFLRSPMPLDDWVVGLRTKNRGWAKGFMQVEFLRSAVGGINYVQGYLDKSKSHNKGRDFLQKRPSPGMGLDYLVPWARTQGRNSIPLIGPGKKNGIWYTVPGARKKYVVDPRTGCKGLTAFGKTPPWEYQVRLSHPYAIRMVHEYCAAFIRKHGRQPDYTQFKNVDYDLSEIDRLVLTSHTSDNLDNLETEEPHLDGSDGLSFGIPEHDLSAMARMDQMLADFA